MIPISWAIFSSAPVSQTSIIPTRVPTISMFSIMSVRPTTAKTTTSTVGQPSLRPTILVSATPITMPTLVPSLAPSFAPTSAPSIAPSLMPSFMPTLTPSASPTIQTTVSSLSSSSQATTTNNSTQTYALISAFVGLAIIAAFVFCAFQLFKKKKSPFEKWVDVYGANSPGVAGGSGKGPNPNDEIHHFYRKDQPAPKNSRLSINRNNSFSIPPNMRESSPAFVPYVPKNETRRYSNQTMVQLNNRL
jgi:hypothetical protein